MISGSVEDWALTVSSSGVETCGRENDVEVVWTTRITTSEPAGRSNDCLRVTVFAPGWKLRSAAATRVPLTVAVTWSPALRLVAVTRKVTVDAVELGSVNAWAARC